MAVFRRHPITRRRVRRTRVWRARSKKKGHKTQLSFFHAHQPATSPLNLSVNTTQAPTTKQQGRMETQPKGNRKKNRNAQRYTFSTVFYFVFFLLFFMTQKGVASSERRCKERKRYGESETIQRRTFPLRLFLSERDRRKLVRIIGSYFEFRVSKTNMAQVRVISLTVSHNDATAKPSASKCRPL